MKKEYPQVENMNGFIDTVINTRSNGERDEMTNYYKSKISNAIDRTSPRINRKLFTGETTLPVTQRSDFTAKKYDISFPEAVDYKDANKKSTHGVHTFDSFCTRELKKFDPKNKPKSILIKKKD